MRSLGTLFSRGAGVALSLAVAGSAQGVIISDGAGLGQTSDWAGVGIVETFGGIAGTGTLVGPRQILTAGHVVAGLAANQVEFTIDGSTYSATSFALHPQYSATNDRYDVAVITLGQDLALPSYAFNTGTVNELTAGPATLVGFGVGGEGTTGQNGATYPAGTKRAGVNVIGAVTTDSMTVGQRTYTDAYGETMTVDPGLILFDFDNPAAGSADPLGDGGALAHEANSTERDSGAPLFQFANGQWFITGIVVNGFDGAARYGDIGINVRLADVAPFVTSQVPEPGVAGLVVAGALGAGLRRRRR